MEPSLVHAEDAHHNAQSAQVPPHALHATLDIKFQTVLVQLSQVSHHQPRHYSLD